MKTVLLLCFFRCCFSFGDRGARASDIRSRREPIVNFSPHPTDTRRFHSEPGKATMKDESCPTNANARGTNEVDQNRKYIESLVKTLEGLCDKWIVSGSMGTRRRAYNLLQQVHRLAMDKEQAAKAQRMMIRSGMPLEPPPSMPEEEHVPAVDQQISQPEKTKYVKPMGAMIDSEFEKQRTDDVNERLQWEKKRQNEANGARSALSARQPGPGPNGAMLDGVVNGADSVESLSSFANDKKDLQATMEGAVSKPKSDGPSVVVSNKKKRQHPSASNERSLRRASEKNSELIAKAGSGGAFLGSALGVGGLDDVLSQIQRRVWIPLAAPPTLLNELGIQPVRGLLLYGSPGCGKTLLARKLGSILSPCRPITIVSGPEILDKFVGSSEQNLREIFDKPPDLYPQYKKNYGEPLATQAIHVIVLDEFDAISRRRGGSGGKGSDQGDAGVARDSVVNQLLAKMDGVDGLGVPTLLIGLTNKPSLIDPALMRPGRFEVQIEVPKPRTVEQRVAILKVHTENMVKNGRVLVRDAPENTAAWNRLQKSGEHDAPSYVELLDLLAVECDGMSGASLAGVARAAASRALERAVTSFAGHSDSSTDEPPDGSSMMDCLVTTEDFEKAIEDVFDSAKGSSYEEDDAEGKPEGKKITEAKSSDS